jgi:hypothetical protein
MSLFNLAIATPNLGTVATEYALCLAQTCLFMQKHVVPGYKQNGLMVLSKKSSILPKLRHDLVEDAIAAKCTHLLFIDSDQSFPADIVHRLAQHKKQVVGCNIAVKTLPSNPTARNFDPTHSGGHAVYSNGKSGLERVWRVGCGVLLLDLSIFAKLPKPWFDTSWNAELNDFTGEDWYFCELLDKAGIPIYVDHAASKLIGHVGQFVFEHQHINQPQSQLRVIRQGER